MIGLNVLNVLALAVDTAMVGRMPDPEVALTGLGYGVQILFLMMVAMMGLTVGNVAFVARAHGAHDEDRVNHILLQSSAFAVVLGLAVALVGNLVAVPLLQALGASEASTRACLPYLRPMLVFTGLNYLNILYGSTLRGVGNTSVAFFVALLSNAINFGLNFLLINGNFGFPALGVAGAAVGTITSHAVAVALMIASLRAGVVPGIRPVFRWIVPDLELGRNLLRVGAPASLDMLVLNAAFLSIIGMLGRLDQDAVAAHGIGLRIQALAFVPGLSVSQAIGAMTGNALGAGDVEETRRVLRSGLVLCIGIMSSIAAVVLVGAPHLVTLFDIDPTSHVGAYAVTWMRLLGWCMPVAGVWVAYSGQFQGAGATRINLRINTTITFLVQIPLSWLLGFPLGLGAWGVWFAFPASFVLKAIWAVYEHRRGTWAAVGATV